MQTSPRYFSDGLKVAIFFAPAFQQTCVQKCDFVQRRPSKRFSALAFKLHNDFINALSPFGSELGMAVGRLAVGKASRKVSTTSMEIYGGQRRR